MSDPSPPREPFIRRNRLARRLGCADLLTGVALAVVGVVWAML